MEKFPVTTKGYRVLQEELQQLKSIERPSVIKAIAEAREHGDLSENAEYSAAREKQSFIEGRIKDLQDKISRADVIDPATLEGCNIMFGATVLLAEVETGEEKNYQIVGETESDINAGLISISSPLARALIGKGQDDVVEVSTPGGIKGYEVISVLYQ